MKLFSQYLHASKSAKRSVAAIMLEALRLRISSSRLGFSEYIDYQLYKSDLSWEEKSQYGGGRAQNILEQILVDDFSRFLSIDKVTMYALLGALEFPVPKLLATYRSLRAGPVTQLQTAEDLEYFLREKGNLPIYMKRSYGCYGRGNTLISHVEGDRVVLASGITESMSKFCQSFDDGQSLGWMLQEPLINHEALTQLTGSEKISSLRIHTFLTADSVTVTEAILKINIGTSDTDNFENGASGNMLGAIDLSTGRVTRVISGIGLDQIQNPCHPIGGKSIVGFEIPYWKQTLDMVSQAASVFPGYLCPGWDIAVCQDGPKILEVNAFGDISLVQHATRAPFANQKFLMLMNQRGLSGLSSARPKKYKQSKLNNRFGVRKHHWQW